jgi:hypothetical protein
MAHGYAINQHRGGIGDGAPPASGRELTPPPGKIAS